MTHLQECVVTLPLAPKPDIHIGFFLPPVVADMLAKFLDVPFVLALNRIGRRFQERDRILTTNEYLSYLQRLGVTPDVVWTDDNSGYQTTVQETSEILAANNELRVLEENVLCCQCGIIEVPERAVAGYQHSRDLYNRKGSDLVCTVCDGVCVKRMMPSLYLEFKQPVSLDIISIYPAIYRSEARYAFSNYLTRPWRVSRIRDTQYTATISGIVFNLDTDFSWTFSFTDLSKTLLEPVALVNGNRTLRQVLTSALLNYRCGLWRPKAFSAFLTPFLLDTNYKMLSPAQYGANVLTSEYEQDTLRFWLATTLKWHKKDVPINKKDIFRVVSSINKLRAATSTMVPAKCLASGFIKATNSLLINQSLDGARKDVQLSPEGRNLHHVFSCYRPLPSEADVPGRASEVYQPFVRKLEELLGQNLECLLLYGSGTRTEHEIAHDQDLVIIIRRYFDDATTLVREAAGKLPLDMLFDFHLVYLDEILSDPDWLSSKTCGAFFAHSFKKGLVLFGRNPFASLPLPSDRQLKISLLQKLQQYTTAARHTVVASAFRELESGELIYLFKRVWMAIKDLLLWVDVDQMEPNARFIELQARFPSVLEKKDMCQLREWLSWLPDLDAKIVAMDAEDRIELGSSILHFCETFYRLALRLAEKDFGMHSLAESYEFSRECVD